jgi:hypothetical protein
MLIPEQKYMPRKAAFTTTRCPFFDPPISVVLAHARFSSMSVFALHPSVQALVQELPKRCELVTSAIRHHLLTQTSAQTRIAGRVASARLT